MNPGEMTALYIKLRDEKKSRTDAFKKSLEKIDAGMEKLEGLLLAHLQESGASSLASPAGTVYRKIDTSATVEDAQAFEEWLLDQPNFDGADIKPNKTMIKELLEAGQPPPPGVKVTQIASVGIQRK